MKEEVNMVKTHKLFLGQGGVLTLAKMVLQTGGEKMATNVVSCCFFLKILTDLATVVEGRRDGVWQDSL